MSRLKSEYRYQFGASRIGRLGFSSWLHLVTSCMKIDRRMYDNHIRPQTELVPECAEFFRLEEGLDPIVDLLDKVLGESAPDITIEHLLKREPRPIHVTRSDAALIASIFAADYQRFGYKTPDEDGLPNDPYAGLRALLAKLVAPLIVFKHRLDWLR